MSLEARDTLEKAPTPPSPLAGSPPSHPQAVSAASGDPRLLSAVRASHPPQDRPQQRPAALATTHPPSLTRGRRCPPQSHRCRPANGTNRRRSPPGRAATPRKSGLGGGRYFLPFPPPPREPFPAFPAAEPRRGGKERARPRPRPPGPDRPRLALSTRRSLAGRRSVQRPRGEAGGGWW